MPADGMELSSYLLGVRDGALQKTRKTEMPHFVKDLGFPQTQWICLWRHLAGLVFKEKRLPPPKDPPHQQILLPYS